MVKAVGLVVTQDGTQWEGVASVTEHEEGQVHKTLEMVRITSPIATFDCTICAGKAMWEEAVVQLAEHFQ